MYFSNKNGERKALGGFKVSMIGEIFARVLEKYCNIFKGKDLSHVFLWFRVGLPFSKGFY